MRKNGISRYLSQNCSNYMPILPLKTETRELISLGLDRCMDAVGARSGSVFIFDKNRKELVLQVAKNPEGNHLEGIRFRLGESITGKVALKKKPLLVRDIDKENFLKNVPRYDHYKSKSFLSVPLEALGDLIGVVNITDKPRGLSFDDDDLRMVLNIAKYLGVSLFSLDRYLEKQSKVNEKLAKELKELKAEHANCERLSSFAKLMGGLVHEINNPLDGVIRYVNLSFDNMQQGGAAREYLRHARIGLSRIAKVIRSLLDFSWSLSSSSGDIDINRMIETVLFSFNNQFVSNNVEVKQSLSPNLPKFPNYKLKLVFANIIKNACEAMEHGGELTVYSALSNGNLKITISDTGEGVPKELRDKIFEPFFTTKALGEGSGLGLAICYEIIHRYRGNISVEGEADKGTTFIIELPLKARTQ